MPVQKFEVNSSLLCAHEFILCASLAVDVECYLLHILDIMTCCNVVLKVHKQKT